MKVLALLVTGIIVVGALVVAAAIWWSRVDSYERRDLTN